MADDASIYVFHADTEGLNFRRTFADALHIEIIILDLALLGVLEQRVDLRRLKASEPQGQSGHHGPALQCEL